MAGVTPLAVTTLAARAAASTDSNRALRVCTSPVGSGRSLRVASTITASVPSLADEQRREIESGDALDGAVPGAEESAVRQYRGQPEHGLPRDAVLDAQQPAGIRREVAAHGRDPSARGGREPTTVRAERGRR